MVTVSNQTHLIYRALGEPHVETEPCKGICAFCGSKIQEGVKLENTVSDAFTNYDLLTDRTASHVCVACNAACREPTRFLDCDFAGINSVIRY